MIPRSFWYLLSALTVSVVGDVFGLLAIEWLVYDLTGSKLAMGTLALCFGVPEQVVRLVGAPLIDRFDRGRLMALLDAVRFIAFAVPVLLGVTGHLEIWHLYIVAFITGTCSALFAPAALAVIPSLVEKEQLVRTNSLLDGAIKTASLVAPTVAGVWLVGFGALSALGINAASFALSALLTLLLPRLPRERFTTEPPATPAVKKGALRAYIGEALAGWTFFKQYPFMLVIMLFMSVTNMSAVAVSTLYVPYVQDVLLEDASALGLLGTCMGVGSLGGVLLISFIGELKRRRLPMLGSMVLRGLLFAWLGLTHNLYAALALAVVVGLSGPFFGSYSSALYGQLVPPELRGRVMSMRLLVGGSLQPLGGFLGGAGAQLLGVPLLFVAAGLVQAVCGSVGFMTPLLKELDGEIEEVAARRRPLAGETQAVSM